MLTRIIVNQNLGQYSYKVCSTFSIIDIIAWLLPGRQTAQSYVVASLTFIISPKPILAIPH